MTVTFETRLEFMETEKFWQQNRFKQVKFAIFLVAAQLTLLCLFMRFAGYPAKVRQH